MATTSSPSTASSAPGYLWGVMDANTLIITVDGDRVFEQKLGGDEDLEAVDVRQAQGVGEINDRFKNIKRAR